jgi:hypothetical protein
MSRTTQNLTITEDTSWERLWANEVRALLRILYPWVVLGLVLNAGWLAHLAWGRMPAVPWAVAGLVLAGTGLSAFTWFVSRLVTAGRVHSCASVAAAGLWLTIATITGPVAPVTGALLGIFGSMTALTWNIRRHVRSKADSNDGPAGRLSAWFADAAKAAGVPGTTLQVKAIEPTRAQGTVALPAGEKTAADLQQRVRHIESGGKVPPGSLQIAEHPDRADHALVTLSDPRLIRNPVPWPGPSRPGASIALPLRPGIWQDGVPVQHPVPGHHVHIMGSCGAGKSEGGCWCYCAEIITRHDAAIVGGDITKKNQTFGPLEPALHRVEYTRDGVRDLLNRLHTLIPERTEYLADHGLTKWVEGCGLTYLNIWLEEVPDIYDALTSKEQDHFQSDVKALRSAGGTWWLSLQRSDWSQLPTIVRGQMASMTFGLQRDSDERFGLSEKQREMGASPSSWGTDHPGMAYLHYPGTPPERIAMPMRTYAWGDLSSKERHDETAAPTMAAYAAQWPASARPVDNLTATLITPRATPARQDAASGQARPVAVITRPADSPGAQDQDETEDEETENVCSEYLTTEDPTPGLEAGIDDPIEAQDDDAPFEFDQPDPLPPDKAREVFAAHLAKLRQEGRTALAPRDFRPIMRPGMGRAWIQARLKEAVESGQLEHDRDEGTYQFPAAA